MWSSTNQRIKALMSARAREKERLTRPIHVRRADVVLSFRSDDDFLHEVPARGLLNDLTPAGFSVYAATPLNPNAEITVEIEHPKHFRLTAKVVWCQYQPSSTRVLTPQSYAYRVGLALIWHDAKLEEEFKTYCSELEELYVNPKARFLEEAFKSPAPPVAALDTNAKDPHDVPAPTESDEGGAPSDEQVAAEIAASAAADVANAALQAANPSPAAPVPTPVEALTEAPNAAEVEAAAEAKKAA